MTPAQKKHLEAIAEFQSQAFGESYEVALHYAKAALADKTGRLYIVMKDQKYWHLVQLILVRNTIIFMDSQ